MALDSCWSTMMKELILLKKMGYSSGLIPATITPLSPSAQTETGYSNAEAAILGLLQQQKDLDPDKLIATIAPSSLPSPLPNANRGEYFLFNSSGTITVNGIDYIVNQGDRLWCNADDTASGNETNWEILLVSISQSPYYAKPIVGVYETAPTNLNPGDRYILNTDITQIQTIGGNPALFPDGAIVSELGSNGQWQRVNNSLQKIGLGDAGQTATLFLDIGADVWVNFPDPGFDYSHYQIYLGNNEVSGDFLIRIENETSQIRSSVAYSNLKFIFYV